MERSEGLSPTPASRSALFGDWPVVLASLCHDGRNAMELATALERVSLVKLSPQTLGAMLRKLGWATDKQRALARKGENK